MPLRVDPGGSDSKTGCIPDSAGLGRTAGSEVTSRVVPGTSTRYSWRANSAGIAIGSEVRIVLDAAPQYVIPATISFVASQAQFTPKTVETANERQKLMFRVRAQIPEDLLRRHLEQVKTGVPGVAWIRLDSDQAWPADLVANVPVE